MSVVTTGGRSSCEIHGACAVVCADCVKGHKDDADDLSAAKRRIASLESKLAAAERRAEEAEAAKNALEIALLQWKGGFRDGAAGPSMASKEYTDGYMAGRRFLAERNAR